MLKNIPSSPLYAYIAATWAILFAIPHIYWGAGGRTGLAWSLATKGPAEVDLINDRSFQIAGLWGVAVLLGLAAVIALAMVRPWGERIPHWLVSVAAFGVSTVCLLRSLFYSGFVVSTLRLTGVIDISANADRDWFIWDLILWSPWFLLASVLFAGAALTYRQRHVHPA